MRIGLPAPAALGRAVIGALALAAAGCGGGYADGVAVDDRAVLAVPDRLEILALDPNPIALATPPLPPGEAFHGHRILGFAELEDAREREALLALVREGIDDAPPASALCFLPRHGLRATRDERAVDVLLCFECRRVELHGPGGARTALSFSDAVGERVDALYAAHGLGAAGR